MFIGEGAHPQSGVQSRAAQVKFRLFRASSACIRGFEPVLKPVRVRSLLSLKFSCHVEYIMSLIMSTGGFRGIIGIVKSESCNFWNCVFFEKIEL